MSDRIKEAIGIIVLAGILAVFCAVLSVRAEMAPNFPPENHNWLHTQRSPDGVKCCDPGDCWLISYRIAVDVPAGNSGYQVFYGGNWLNVPMRAVTRLPDNPTGNAILCINNATLMIYCFIPGPEG